MYEASVCHLLFFYSFVDHETTDLAWNWRLLRLCMATALQHWSYYTSHKVHAHIGSSDRVGPVLSFIGGMVNGFWTSDYSTAPLIYL
jgi:hypothetical protein